MTLLVVVFLTLWIGTWTWLGKLIHRQTGSKIIGVSVGFITSLLISLVLLAVTVGPQMKAKREAERMQLAALQAEQAEAQKKREEAQRQEARAKREAERRVEEARCRTDLQCGGDKKSLAAIFKCQDPIEGLAKHQAEWTDGWLEPKFSHFRWKDQTRGIVTYFGDKIKFQNGFGAWTIHTYECDYDTEQDTALAVRAQPGRLS